MGASMKDQVLERLAEISVGARKVRGVLVLPPAASAVVAFAHGSGSGRFSPRNQFVAKVLQQSRLGTLLIDLLEEDEAEDRSRVFDIGLLADRLQAAADWLATQRETLGMPLGYFGASTGAAAALWPRPGNPPRSPRSSHGEGGPTWLASRFPRSLLPRS